MENKKFNHREELLKLIKKQTNKINALTKIYGYDGSRKINPNKKYLKPGVELFKLLNYLREIGDYKKDYDFVYKNYKTLEQCIPWEYNLNEMATEKRRELETFLKDYNESPKYRIDKVLNPKNKKHYEELKQQAFKKTFYERAENIDIITKDDYKKYIKQLINGVYAREGKCMYYLAAAIMKWEDDALAKKSPLNEYGLIQWGTTYGMIEDPYKLYKMESYSTPGGCGSIWDGVNYHLNKNKETTGVYKTNPTLLPPNLEDKINYKKDPGRYSKYVKRIIDEAVNGVQYEMAPMQMVERNASEPETNSIMQMAYYILGDEPKPEI